MTRRCPRCGEPVPSSCITCPACYAEVPRDVKDDEYVIVENAVSTERFSRKAVLLLALIPSAFGFMGLGQLYMKEWRKGLLFLAAGLVLFVSLYLLLSGFGSLSGAMQFLTLGCTILTVILFIGTYALQAFDALVRSLFKI